MAISPEEAYIFSLLTILFCQRLQLHLSTYYYLLRKSVRRRRIYSFLCILKAQIIQRRLNNQINGLRARQKAWVLPRPQYWFQELVNNSTAGRKTSKYRVILSNISAGLLDQQITNLRNPIPVEKRVAVGLWQLATGDCYRTCALAIGLSKASAVYCSHELVQELCRLKNGFIKFPTSVHEIKKKIEGFEGKSKIPNVVGAVHGTHIPIKAPILNHEDYFNRKHFYSYVAQGVVDASKLHLSVSTGYTGSMHDARVLRLSELYDEAENDNVLMEPTVDINGTVIRPLIVGDSAYPLKTWLLRPLKDNGTLNQFQRNYNKELSKARVGSEHAFDSTKNKWRVLQKRLDEESERIPDTIFACCVLHNICVLQGDDSDEDDEDDDDDDDNDAIPSRAASDVLQAVVDYLSYH